MNAPANGHQDERRTFELVIAARLRGLAIALVEDAEKAGLRTLAELAMLVALVAEALEEDL